MKRVIGFLLTGLLFLTACATQPPGPPAAVATEAPTTPPPSTPPPSASLPSTSAPSTTAPSTSPPTTPPTRVPEKEPPVGALAEICRSGGEFSSRTESLWHYIETTLQGVEPAGVKARIAEEPGTCLHARKGDRTDIFLITDDRDLHSAAVVAWREQGRWRVAPVDHIEDILRIRKDSLVDGRPDLLMTDQWLGPGTGRRLLHFRIDVGGQPVITDLTRGRWSNASFDFPTDDLVLVTDPSRLWDVGSCRFCMPERDQTLYRWDGDKLTKLGSRTHGDPVVTLNLLRHSLQHNRSEEAAALVSDPALLPPARQALPGNNGQYERYGPGPGAILDLEAHNWDLLPPAVRTTLPPRLQTYFATVQLDSGTALMRLDRRPVGWLVTGVSLPDAAKKPWLERAAALLRPFDQATELRVDGDIRLIHTGSKAAELLNDGWTWLEWQDGAVRRFQALYLADAWKPFQAVRLPESEGAQFIIVRQEAVPPHRMAAAVHAQGHYGLHPDWGFGGGFPGAWELAKTSPVPFVYEGDELIASEGATITLREHGQEMLLCARGGPPCIRSRWNGKQHEIKP